MNPNQYERRILVCVTGLSPQIVTETIYALAHQKEPWVPTEVHVLTTREGANRANLLLLAPDRAQFHRLVNEYDLEEITFDEHHIHVLKDGQGRPMEDIRTQNDNMATADGILRKMAEFSADPDCAIHVSLAGGRKSMGFFAGYALSLCGRPQDRLSHVLVSPEFESHAEFFFPPKDPRVLITRANDPVSTRDAIIELADIPFVRLRANAPKELIEQGNFREVVEAAQRVAGPPRLRVCLKERIIECAGESIQLPPYGIAIYAWHAWRRKHMASSEVVLNEFNAIVSTEREELRQFGEKVFTNDTSIEAEEWENRPWNSPSEEHKDWLTLQRTRINDRIAKALGDEGRARYGIQSVPVSGRRSAHMLDLPGECIEFADSVDSDAPTQVTTQTRR